MFPQEYDFSIRATPLFLSFVFLLSLGALLFVYRNSFGVKPSGDDFTALHQVHRGEQEGAWTFFIASDGGDYRPLQNVTFWLFGTFSERHVLLSLRILHFLSFAFYALVAFLWIHALNFSRIGAVAAACVVIFHPVLAGPLAGLDNYTRLVVSALVWLGAWVAYSYANKPLLALPLVSICFVIGLGYMEYAISLIPLAVLATVWRAEKQRFRWAARMLICLIAILTAYFLVRVSGLVVTSSGAGHLSPNPLIWVKNAGMMLASILFFGNTVSIMLGMSLPKIAWLGSNIALVACAVGYGLWVGNRYSVPFVTGYSGTRSAAEANGLIPLQFLGVAFVISFFPMLLMKHISEIYLTPITLPLALLTGLAAHGWTAVSRPFQYVAIFFAISQLLLASNAIQSKVAGVNDAGERADGMIQQVLKHIPNDGQRKKAAIVFLKENVAQSKNYSIFALPDDLLIQAGYATYAVRWFRPNQDIFLDHFVVEDPHDVDLKLFDRVLLWDDSIKQFTPISPTLRIRE